MVRIAYLIDTIECNTAGTQRQLLETIKRIDRRKFKPHLICLWESEWMRQNDLPCDYSVLRYTGFIKPNFPAVIFRLMGLIGKLKIQIIQTFFEDSIFVAYIGGVLRKPRPILLSSRRDMGLGNENQPIYHRLYKLVLPLVNKSFTGIIANSSNVKSYVAKREKTSISKIHVIYNGIDIETFSKNSATIPELLKQNDCDLRIGIVASLTPVKRHDCFLNAYAMLIHELKEMRFSAIFFGDGVEKDHLFELANRLGISSNVIFAGAVNNVSDYLPHLDVGVLCSDREGLSNAIMEYMAAGLPVIATAVGGNVELVDETNGICIPAADPKSLAGALRNMAKDSALRKRLGRASLDKLRRNFSWPKTMTQLENYYQSLVSGYIK